VRESKRQSVGNYQLILINLISSVLKTQFIKKFTKTYGKLKKALHLSNPMMVNMSGNSSVLAMIQLRSRSIQG
jgi:hypothetical protein